jgi:hypothetical protein
MSHILPFDLQGRLPSFLGFRAVRYLAVSALWAAMAVWILFHRHRALGRWARVALVPLLATLTFFVFPPVHSTNSLVLESLWRELFASQGGLDWGFVAELAAFHGMIVLLKPSLVIGAFMLVSVATAFLSAPRQPELRLPLAMTLCYAAFLLLLPWAQTRYLMPVFPMLALFAASGFMTLLRLRRRTAAAVAVAAIGVLGYDYALCYPDLQLNGHQWVGSRYLFGRSTVGYRGIVHTPSDGVQQALRWTCARAAPGDTVLTFVAEDHIFRTECGRPGFDWINGLREPFSLEEADYVVTTINTDLSPGHGPDNPRGVVFAYPFYDRIALEGSHRRAYSVDRAFEIEVAAVWTRREPEPPGPAEEAR